MQMTIMRHMKRSGVSVVFLFVGFAFAVDMVPAIAQDAGARQLPAGVQVIKAASGSMVLADAQGMTLYTFVKDTAGVSNCNDNCAKNWPPLMAAADAEPAGNWTVVTRADGSRQWAYKGMALYTWIKDSKPGDTSGDGVGGVWKVAVP